MIVRLLLAALGAGLLAGLLITPVQYLKVVPLILHAERFEAPGGPEHAMSRVGLATSAHAAVSDEAASGAAGSGAAGLDGRLLGTLSANVVTGAGFALLLAAASLLSGVAITARTGAFWGLAGFTAATLAPALGLPPELPAMPAAELGARQAWWGVTVALTALGIFALAFRPEPWMKAAGVLALALPHLYGAPRPADLASPIPPTLAAEFAVASLATGVAFWLVLGILAGVFLDRAGVQPAGVADAR